MSYEVGGNDFELTGLGIAAIVAVGALAVKAISDANKAESNANQPDRSGRNRQRGS